MFKFLSSLARVSPDPFPSSTSFDETKVNPGAIGGIVLLLLTLAVVLLLFSFNRHIKKVNFDPEETQP
jgi:hypothetical protein